MENLAILVSILRKSQQILMVGDDLISLMSHVMQFRAFRFLNPLFEPSRGNPRNMKALIYAKFKINQSIKIMCLVSLHVLVLVCLESDLVK